MKIFPILQFLNLFIHEVANCCLVLLKYLEIFHKYKIFSIFQVMDALKQYSVISIFFKIETLQISYFSFFISSNQKN